MSSNNIVFIQVADLKHQLGVMDMRQSQMLLIDEVDELGDELTDLRDTSALPKSAQPSVYSGAVFSSASPAATTRTNLSRHRNDLKQLERERKEQYEVRSVTFFDA